MPIIIPRLAPISGPTYGITLMIPAKRPIKTAFFIPSKLSPILTIMVIMAICKMTPMKYLVNKRLTFFNAF